MSVSYADAASTKLSTKTDEAVENCNSHAPATPEHTTEQNDGKPKDTEKVPKSTVTLAPAPLPVKSVWGTAPTSAAPIVDEQKFPTPGLVPETAQNTPNTSAKFAKSNKWIPITAKVVFASHRNALSSGGNGSSQKNKRRGKAPRKKSTSAESNGDGLKKDDTMSSNKPESESEVATTDASSDSEALHSGSDAQSQSSYSADAKHRSHITHANANQQKGYKKYQNGSYNGRMAGSQQQQLPMHRHQGNGYYQPMLPQQYQMNNKNYRSVPILYGRNGSSGNIAMGGYIPPNSMRPIPGSMPFIPHQPQPMMGNMPYAAPIPIHIPPPLSPKQNPQQALTQQIDYYFSLENLIRDLYLRKNMETEGWVDLDLILNFKRVEIIINGLRNSIDDPNEKSKEKKLDKAIVQAVQDCINLEIGYLNGKENYNAMTREIQLRLKHNFEQWLLPENL